MRTRPGKPTAKGRPPPDRSQTRDSQAEVPTKVYEPDHLGKRQEQAAPTGALGARQEQTKGAPSAKPASTPVSASATGPIQSISMKTPAADKLAVDAMRAEPVIKRPKLRAMAEVALQREANMNLGFMAPPRDPVETRARRMRELMVLASASVIIASIVALVIWFLAR